MTFRTDSVPMRTMAVLIEVIGTAEALNAELARRSTREASTGSLLTTLRIRFADTLISVARLSTSRATAGTIGTASSDLRQASPSTHSVQPVSKMVPDEVPARMLRRESAGSRRASADPDLMIAGAPAVGG